MKVVLFCGGEGMRIREHAGPVPKPMVRIGARPILWHVMRYYAHYGHREFILCLGHGAAHIKDYFVNYAEYTSNDFVLDRGRIDLLATDIDDWKITFVDTGLDASVGERLMAVKPFLGDDPVFLANYADGVSDAPLDRLIEYRQATGKACVFVGVAPNYTSHVVESDADGNVTGLTHVTKAGLRINGGFFVLHQRVFDYMRAGEELVEEPLQRMIAAQDVATYAYDGFWACMDTFKEKRLLEDMQRAGGAPWEVWNRVVSGDGSGVAAGSLQLAEAGGQWPVASGYKAASVQPLVASR
jgi:glucose-1-phosphate cytidylyltransferase